MLYSELIQQEGEYTYSANVQFDIENDKKLARFIPNETTIELLREYFIDIIRSNSSHHARILYGSYGTGKSHFLTVLSQLLSKSYTDGVAFKTFLGRIREYDVRLAEDINKYISDTARKPKLIVPIVFDFEDFDRCLYFSLNKKLQSVGIKVSFKTFYTQALEQLKKWKESEESNQRLLATCEKNNIDLNELENRLLIFDSKAEVKFQKIFSDMTFGVKFICEVSNLVESLDQTVEAISGLYDGIVFIFDEFGRYLEDNIRKIKVGAIQDIAEYCDNHSPRNHIILVSHKEINLYTRKIGKSLANEWKKVEGRYNATPINDKQDQCLSLIRNVLSKNRLHWRDFQNRYKHELERIYSEALDFHGFLIDVARNENPFEGGYPLHPIALYALDKLSKKVAQNERTFFTYLAGKDENSLYRFLNSHDTDNGFTFVGIDEIYNYFEPSIKSLQSDASYEWYKKLQGALSKNKSSSKDNSPEVKILKVIAAIGVINDSSTLVANKKTILSVIDSPKDILSNALDALCEKKILKYFGSYDRYDFYDSSIYDVDKMIAEESSRIKDEVIIKTLNEEFVNFVLYPYQYNADYKISRVFVPVFALPSELARKNLGNQIGRYYDGALIFVVGDEDTLIDNVIGLSNNFNRAILILSTDTQELKDSVKQYIAICYLESQKVKYVDNDPSFEKEILYYKAEAYDFVVKQIEYWKQSLSESAIINNGQKQDNIISFYQLSNLASQIMEVSFPQTLIVNNELINKNTVSASITAARKNSVRAILNGEPETEYFNLSFLSPEYIAVRSVLAKNEFILNLRGIEFNHLANGTTPQAHVKAHIANYIEKAKTEFVSFGDLYADLKREPYGLRDGYLALIFAQTLSSYKKALIIKSHGAEQELSADLFEDIIKRPDDFDFTIASWSKNELDFIDGLEQLFTKYINQNKLSQNRLKAIYEAMMSHYKNVTKFARTTQLFVSESTKKYRKLLEKSYSNYSEFILVKLKKLSDSYNDTLTLVKNIKLELESAIANLCIDLAHNICVLFKVADSNSLACLIKENYDAKWASKRQKSFDYYTNAFLEFASKVTGEESDTDIILALSKSLTGFELLYWSDTHKDEFCQRLSEIKNKLDSYETQNSLGESETKLTLVTASGKEKSIVFDKSELNQLSKTIKNKINATFNNYGLSITYDDKIQVLLSLIEELIEGN